MTSIIVPVFNEEESLPASYNSLHDVFRQIHNSREIIFIDDGSTDHSLDTLKKIAATDPSVRIFSFRKNHGKAEALTFGFQKAKGNLIVTLDADLQDNPSEIQKLIDKMNEGYDVVCGWRKNRKDSFAKIFFSKIFNRLVYFLWGLRLNDYNCSLKVYRKDAAKSLFLYGGMHRFIPLLAHEQGFRVAEVSVEHRERRYGKSKYGISKVIKDIPDVFTMLFITRYSKRPMHFFGTIGGVLFVTGVVVLIYLSFLHFQGIAIGRRPLLLFGILLVIVGIQIFFTGFLADLLLNATSKDNKEPLLKYSTK